MGIIEDQLAGTSSLYARDLELQQTAEPIVQKLRRAGYEEQKTAKFGSTEAIVRDSVPCDDARSVGYERLCLAALSALDLHNILKCQGFSSCDTRIAMALIIARRVHSSSEREAYRW